MASPGAGPFSEENWAWLHPVQVLLVSARSRLRLPATDLRRI